MIHRISNRRGFSLVELMVVVGIIAVLMAFAFPAINGVRKRAAVADNTALLQKMVSAIEAYYNDFRAYPGAYTNNQITKGQCTLGPSNLQLSLSSQQGNFTNRPTSSESLLLALSGGLYVESPNGAYGKYQFRAEEVGRGAMSLNPVSPKRYPIYLEVSANELTAPGEMVASEIPEYMDRFPERKAILYLRAVVGAKNLEDSNDAKGKYNPNHLHEYLIEKSISNHFNPTMRDTKKGFATFSDYIASPVDKTQPRQKDSYILINAGPDRIYGTKDDITNMGSLQ